MGFEYSENELYHHGIKGQKWGVRRYQNPDGSLTPEGLKKYGNIDNYNRIKKGDNVEKTFGREQRRFEKKAEKATAKREKVLAKDNGVESSKSKRLAEKVRVYTDSANFRKSMLKAYDNMAASDRDKVGIGLTVSNALFAAGLYGIPFAHIGAAVASTYSTNKLAKAVDSKNGMLRYNNTSLFTDKATQKRLNR